MKQTIYLIALLFLGISCTNQKQGMKLIPADNFNKVVDGKQVSLYTLKNANGVYTQITNFGGRIVTFVCPDKNGQMADVVLGFNSIDEYLHANEAFHGALIGRVGNRIGHGKFILDGIEYNLPLNNGPNQLHGGPKGFHNVVWDVKKCTENSILLSYLSVDGEMGYPGNLNVEIGYELNDQNELLITYHATTDKATVVNLTAHPFFNLAGEGNGTINNHILMINADMYTPVDSVLIPFGQNETVENTPFDFRKPKAIGTDLNQEQTNIQLKNGKGYDHNFVLNQPVPHQMGHAATITDPVSGRSMEIYTEEPGIQFYGGNFMNGSDKGNSGKPYNYRESFALETQHFPDSPNQPAFPPIVLRPGEEYNTKTIYKFTVAQ